jgi:hypothetical protein
MKAKKSGTDYEPVELPKPTTTVARCYSIIDIGTVPEFYEGKSVGKKHKVYITWELPEFKAVFNNEKGEEPFVIGKELTLSTKDNSNFSKLVSQWRNKKLDEKEQEEFDVTVLLDKTCMISFIVQRKSKFKNEEITKITNENSIMVLNGIMPRPKGIAKPAPLNPAFIFDWEQPFDADKFSKIPKFIQTKMKNSDEYLALDSKVKTAVESETGETPAAETAGEIDDKDW